jgi:hypothetical protein
VHLLARFGRTITQAEWVMDETVRKRIDALLAK